MRTNNKKNHQKLSLHLYNPKKEGLGCYDVNYINAFKKVQKSRCEAEMRMAERRAA